MKRIVGRLSGIDVKCLRPRRSHAGQWMRTFAPADGAFTGPCASPTRHPGRLTRRACRVRRAGRSASWRPAMSCTMPRSSSARPAGERQRNRGRPASAKLVVAGGTCRRGTRLRPRARRGTSRRAAASFDVNLWPRFAISSARRRSGRACCQERVGRAEAPWCRARCERTKRSLDFTAVLEHVDPGFAELGGRPNGKVRAKGRSGAVAGSFDLMASRIASLARRTRHARGTLSASRARTWTSPSPTRTFKPGAYGTAGDALDVNLVAPDLAPIASAEAMPRARSPAQAKLRERSPHPAGTAGAARSCTCRGGYGA